MDAAVREAMAVRVEELALEQDCDRAKQRYDTRATDAQEEADSLRRMGLSLAPATAHVTRACKPPNLRATGQYRWPCHWHSLSRVWMRKR